MKNEATHKASFCIKNGIRIYPIPHRSNHYKLVIARATKLRWSDIPKDKSSKYEEVDKVIYRIEVGDAVYKANPKETDDKWFAKIEELYSHLFDKLKLKK